METSRLDTASQPPLPDEIEDAIAELLAEDQLDASRVESICARHPGFAERIRSIAAHVAELTGQGHPRQVGPYRILRLLGSGGMGVVYLAHQQAPVRRRVALKLIKLGMDSRAVVARFELERQALALMEHEGIARVLDCGTSERGQPYFVMEYVPGVPLRAFCDNNRVSLKGRIELMLQICAAVTHAHQKGVVHRDLKPANILVVDAEGRLQTKIIDFGLAKAVGRKLVETLFTEAGQVVGTLEYMAPEQADPGNSDVDTRADIYSLGAILHELLVGMVPFSAKELIGANAQNPLQDVWAAEPPRPSSRLAAAGAAAAGIAMARRLPIGALRKALRVDLDWLVLRALEKDRNRRYQTANTLAEDLQRYLDHEPLIAGPPSAGYRLRKLLQRHRAQVAGAAAVLVTAVVGATVAGVLAIEKSALATAAQDSAQRLSRTVKLAGVPRYTSLMQRYQDAVPPWPQNLAALRTWIDDCNQLLAMRSEIEQTIAELRTRAEPPTEAELAADRRSHPLHDTWETTRRVVEARRAAAAARNGLPMAIPELQPAVRRWPVMDLNYLAEMRVVPDRERCVFGEPAWGLAFARAAVAALGDVSTPAGPKQMAERREVFDTLAWAEFETGQDERARAAMRRAVTFAPDAERQDQEQRLRMLEDAIRNAPGDLEQSERELDQLGRAISVHRSLRFSAAEDRALYDALDGLARNLPVLATQQRQRIEARIRFAHHLAESAQDHAPASIRWAEAIAAIAVNPRYRATGLPPFAAQVGLVPIGENRVTGLWEFYDLWSAWDGQSDPAAIPVPGLRADGGLEVGDTTGIVFVLVPGGIFWMGAQGTDPQGPNFDPAAESDELLHEVTLGPFLIARHEMTRGQWFRLTGERPSGLVNDSPDGERIGDAHPVEQVSWFDCDQVLRANGMALPTEAQWEYCCRAGTATPYWCGDAAALAGVANCRDTRTDEQSVLAVDQRGANAFGLHDVHGNVWEWCADRYGPYSGLRRPGDGMSLHADPEQRFVYRGGSYHESAGMLRSARRNHTTPRNAVHTIGVRAARSLQWP